MMGKTEDEMKKEYEPQATEAIKSRLVLEAIINAEKIEASEEELAQNSRSRSAKLRVCEKL